MPLVSNRTQSMASSRSRFLPHNSIRELPLRIQDVLLPFHSQLLRESLLISFPPHIDMLKFRGLFRTPDGLWVKICFIVSPEHTLFLVDYAI